MQHVFHYDCLADWFAENMRCPLCAVFYNRGDRVLQNVKKVDELPPQGRNVLR